MAEEVVLMKGNEAIAHAAIRIGDRRLLLAIPSLPNRKYWKRWPKRNLGKLPVWWCYRQKVKSQQSTWYMAVQQAVKW